MKSKYLNYVIKFLKLLLGIYLVGVSFLFIGSYNQADSPNVTIIERLKRSFITPIAFLTWFIYVLIYVPSEKWGPSGPSAYSTTWA